MGACATRLSAEMTSPPHAYSGDPFSPQRPMSTTPRLKRLTRPTMRSSPPANPNAPPPTSIQSSVDRRDRRRPRHKLMNPDYSRGRPEDGRARQASGISPHGTRWGDAGHNGDSKWLDYGCDKECEGGPIARVETETMIPGLSYDQAGRPVWRDPSGAVKESG